MAETGTVPAEGSRATLPAGSAESGTLVPSPGAGIASFLLVGGSLFLAYVLDEGVGFTPRVATIDALAGLAVAAFLVDQLLRFVPPIFAHDNPTQRETDLTVLRFGYGSLLGAAFVIFTDLRAVKALTPGSSIELDAGLDRAIAVLAIAGGVAGLARVLGGINPQPATDGTKKPENAVAADTAPSIPIPPPSPGARGIGLVGVVVGGALAFAAIGDDSGIELLSPETAADGTVALVVRFGPLLLAAAILQEIVEFAVRAMGVAKNDKPVLAGGLAVALGVVAAKVFDLYLLHNIGFFGAAPGVPLNDALAGSSDASHWADAFLTGVAIAAGTKPLHDIASRLRKAKTKQQTAVAQV